jgi:hypothetical protein
MDSTREYQFVVNHYGSAHFSSQMTHESFRIQCQKSYVLDYIIRGHLTPFISPEFYGWSDIIGVI